MTSILKTAATRLAEPSTYAGISAVCLAVADALSQNGDARWAALVSAVVAGLVAIARSEGATGLASVLTQAAPIVSSLVPVVEAAIETKADSGSTVAVAAKAA